MKMEPFAMYPICVHPVLGGETVNNLFIDGRVHLNGVKGTIQGWFLDILYCYVKIRDIDDPMVDMLVNPDWKTAIPAGYQAWSTIPDLGMVQSTSKIAWAYLATTTIYKTYVMREQAYYTSSFLPIAPAKYPTSFQNFYELADDASSDLEGEPDIITRMIEDIDNYADVLERYGIREAAIRRMLPEILLWRSYHNYPVLAAIDDNSEIINRNMCLWSPRESRGTRRGIFIQEPGFIVGLAFIRPDYVERNKREWMAANFVDSTDWFVPPYDLADGIGTYNVADFDNFAYASNVHYNKFETWLNGETYTNIDPDEVGMPTQLSASVSLTPEVNVGFTQIRADYPVQASADVATYLPNLLHTDYYCGGSFQTRMAIDTPLVI